MVAIVNPSSSPMRRLREDAKNEGRLVDASQGRKTRAILVTDSNHVILSAVSADTLGQRVSQLQEDTRGRNGIMKNEDVMPNSLDRSAPDSRSSSVPPQGRAKQH